MCKFACKKSACKSSCKDLHASFLRGFFVEIRHIARNVPACKCCNARGLYCMAGWVIIFFWMAVVFLMQCPHCGSCIEKNGGCNHMVCTKIQQSLSLKDSIHWERKEVQWNPVNTATNGPKKFGCYNEVTVLTRVSLQENVWSFLPGGHKKVAVLPRWP